jgi:hypothetical protein
MGIKDFLVNKGFVTADESTPEESSPTPVKPTASGYRPKAGGFQPVTRPKSVAGTPNSAPTYHVDAPAPVDQSIIDALNATAESSKLTGYTVFRAILDNLGNMPDAQRFLTALNLVKNVNKVEPEDVLRALDDRIALVDADAQQFEAEYQSEVAKQVTEKQNDIQKINEEIEAKKAEIRDLEAQKVTLISESGQAEVDLAQNRTVFNASLDVVKSSLSTERENIARYILPKATK